jgi:hypothetical protein
MKPRKRSTFATASHGPNGSAIRAGLLVWQPFGRVDLTGRLALGHDRFTPGLAQFSLTRLA